MLGLGDCLINVSLLVSDAFGENFIKKAEMQIHFGCSEVFSKNMASKACDEVTCALSLRAAQDWTSNSCHVQSQTSLFMFQKQEESTWLFRTAWIIWHGQDWGKDILYFLPNQQWKQMWDHRILEASGMWKKNKLFLTFYSLNSIQNYFTSVC